MSYIKRYLDDLWERCWNGDDEARLELIDAGETAALHGISKTLNHVADYLSRGFSIVPQMPEAKRPCLKWREFQERRCTATEAYGWWSETWPNAGIAFVLGPISDLFAVDCDGTEAHETLLAHLGGIPKTPMVVSGSHRPNRYHLLFRDPGVPTRAKSTPWCRTLELRGKGAITVGPPSLHPSGNRYRWARGRSLKDVQLAKVPDAILDALDQANVRRQSVPESHDIQAPSLAGISRATHQFLHGKFANGADWNGRLFRAACDLAGCGYPIEKAEPLLLSGAQPWDDHEREAAIATIRSAYSQPRSSARQSRQGRTLQRVQAWKSTRSKRNPRK